MYFYVNCSILQLFYLLYKSTIVQFNGHSINVQKNAYYTTNKILVKKNVNRSVTSLNTRNWMGNLIDENKRQFDEKNDKN